ncbi:hypothetical protein J437_LFUL019348 [Ladona fulva]|uniref:Uncharacterized protein n=1 Tax=Ladona fulva TaxID=123851 RepID=A0A8K0PBA5_LADFU|nr:hypothetical protein J437_LFUL019348 [Ladona fulva]
MPPRCVKCGNNHLTSECKKEAAEAAMCANCKGDHPASYRGCPSYLKLKERLRELKEKAQRKSQRNDGNNNLKTPTRVTANTTTPNRVAQSKVTGNSYADIAKGIGSGNDSVKCIRESVTPSSLELADIIDNRNERNDGEDWRSIMMALVCETHLTPSKEFLVPGYDVFRDDDTKPIRGTAVIVTKEFNAKKISLPSFNKISATGAVINESSVTFFVCVFLGGLEFERPRARRQGEETERGRKKVDGELSSRGGVSDIVRFLYKSVVIRSNH